MENLPYFYLNSRSFSRTAYYLVKLFIVYGKRLILKYKKTFFSFSKTTELRFIKIEKILNLIMLERAFMVDLIAVIYSNQT